TAPAKVTVLPSMNLDGWSNIITGLGRQLYDKAASAVVSFYAMQEMDAENLYAADDNAAKIVDKLPEEAVRKWITLEVGDADLAATIEDYVDQKNIPAHVEHAWKWGRLYGGAAILINVDDGMEMRKPLNLRSIRKVLGFTVLSRWELVPQRRDTDIASPTFGEPLTYTLTPRRGTGMRSAFHEEIHRSRLVIFDGVPLPMRLEQHNHGWGDSVLTRPKDAIRNYAASH